MDAKISGKRRHACWWAAAWMVAFLVVSVFHDSAVAAEGPPTPMSNATASQLADLEHAFWTCDYIATTRGVHVTPVDVCSAVTDELREQKFQGDFLDMLEWWQRHKLAQHASFEPGR